MGGSGSMAHAAKSNANNRSLQTSKRKSFFNRKPGDTAYIRHQQEWQHQPGKTPRYLRQSYWWEKALVGLFLLSMALICGLFVYYFFS